MSKFRGEAVELSGHGIGIPADLSIGDVAVLDREFCDSSDVPMDEENLLDQDLPLAGKENAMNVEEKSHLTLCQEARDLSNSGKLVEAIAMMEQAISIAPKSTQRGWKKEVETWRVELETCPPEELASDEATNAELPVETTAVESNGDEVEANVDDVVQTTSNTLIAVSPRVKQVMEGYGLAQIFTIPKETPTEEVVNILFSLMFQRLLIAIKPKKDRTAAEKKALWGAMRFPLGLLVDHFAGGLKTKMYQIVGESRMSPRKFDKIVYELQKLKFFFYYDREWYQTCFDANLADARSTAVLGAQEEDFLAMEECLGTAVKAIEDSSEVVNTKEAKDLSEALKNFQQRIAEAQKK